MNAQQRTLAVVLGSAFAASLAMSPIASADQNPFGMQALSKGYTVADAKDGKCGTGKCGANKKKADGSCCMGGAQKKADGSCCAAASADGKKADGTCSADKKSK
ncbi:MAG TPA: hypothetical protein VIE69_06300 [Methylophilaceae bacterium]|jgi:uncharacterized low-complexity protein